jgi:hypothetical protein
MDYDILIMIFYHGTDQELVCLKQSSYVTKNLKDACKFGYRRAVLSNSPFVYIYMVDIPEELLIMDKNRDRAYITFEPIKINLKFRYSTYQTPYKLTRFKKEDIEMI